MTDAVKMVEVWRGSILESIHRGHAVIVDDTGQIVHEWGDPERVILPRSSCKMLQSLPLIESGAGDAAKLTDAHLALSCASHNGEPRHVEAVSNWLSGIGLAESDLRCGSHVPMGPVAAKELIKSDQSPCQFHNNCSGKHAGFLTLNKHLGGGSEYVDVTHPVQQAARMSIEELCEESTSGYGIDGCSAPNFAVSLKGLATGMANMAKPRGIRLTEAMAKHPLMVAGDGRACSEIMTALGGRVVIKTGAEAVYTAILPELGFGVALKIEDGTTRASETVMAGLLVHLGVADAQDPMIAKRLNPILRNAANLAVGEIRYAPEI